MKYENKYSPSSSMVVINLKKSEQITGEAGAMIYMTPKMEVQTRKREKSILGTLATTLDR